MMSSASAPCGPLLVGHGGNRGRGGLGRVAVVLVFGVRVVLVPVFGVLGEGPRGEIGIVQVPAETLDGFLVEQLVRLLDLVRASR